MAAETAAPPLSSRLQFSVPKTEAGYSFRLMKIASHFERIHSMIDIDNPDETFDKGIEHLESQSVMRSDPNRSRGAYINPNPPSCGLLFSLGMQADL